jgi:hypothetical protein
MHCARNTNTKGRRAKPTGKRVRCAGTPAAAIVVVRVEHHVVLLHFVGADIDQVPERLQ